jgi:menaquinone-dependent protoporphyrinogen oxidase
MAVSPYPLQRAVAMTRIYIPYATSEGQTAKIAEYLADVVRAHGHEADAVDMKESGDALPPGYDGVIVGASIHMGQHDKHFEKQTGWRPAHVALFGGALLYTQYGFLKRHLMKKIAGDKPGELGTDTSRDYVYTEWDGVKRFAEDFLDDVVSRGAGKTQTVSPGR